MSEGALSIKGLWVGLNDYESAPPGSLAVAHNVFIRGTGVLQQRPGFYRILSHNSIRSLSGDCLRLLAFSADTTRRFIGIGEKATGNNTVTYNGFVEHNDDDTDYVSAEDGPYVGGAENVFSYYPYAAYAFQSAPPPWTTAVANGVPYIKSRLGLSRPGSSGTTLKRACVSAVPNISVERPPTGGINGVLVGNSQTGYRVAMSRLYPEFEVIGPPSPQFVYILPKRQIPISTGAGVGMIRTGNRVDVYATAHGFLSGQNVTIYPGETNFPAGSKTLISASTNEFAYTETGAAVGNTSIEYAWASGEAPMVNIDIPRDYSNGDSVRIYRTLQSAEATIEPGDECYRVYQGAIPARLRINGSLLTRNGSTVTATIGTGHGYQTGDWVYVTPGATYFPAGAYIITAYSNYITWTDLLSYTTTASGYYDIQCARMRITDLQIDSFMGETLYTSPSQEGAMAENAPPANRDCDILCTFRDCLFVAGPQSKYTLETTLLAVNTTGGLGVSDTITIRSATGNILTVLHAGSTNRPEAYDTNYPYFDRISESENSSAIERVQLTAQNIVTVLNSTRQTDNRTVTWGERDRSLAVEAYLTTTDIGQPGRIIIQNSRLGCVGFSVEFSNPGAFYTPNATATRKTPYNLQFSKQGQPESLPAAHSLKVGEGNVTGLVATKDSLIILTDKGIYRLTGSSPADFRVDPLDLTVNCYAPLTVRSLRNKAYALTDRGVAQISDNSVLIISTPIEKLLTEQQVVGCDPRFTFAVSDPVRGLYILCPASARFDSTNEYTCEICGKSTKQFVYSEEADAWSTWGDYDVGLTSITAGACITPRFAPILTYPAIAPWTDTGTLVVPTSILFADSTSRKILGSREPRSWHNTITNAIQEGYENGLHTVDDAIALTSVTVSGTTVTYASQWGACQVGDVIMDDTFQTALVVSTTGPGNATVSISGLHQSENTWLLHRMPVTVQANPIFSDGPGTGHHFQFVDFLFKELTFSNAVLSVAGTNPVSFTDIPILGSDYGIGVPVSFASQQALTTGTRIRVRAWIPLELARGDTVNVKFYLAEAMGRFEMVGFVVGQRTYKGTQK